MATRSRPIRSLFAAASQVRQYSAPSDRSIPPAKQKYIPSSGTYPKGFLVGSAFAGVKASNTKYDDMALIVSEKPCAAAAVFTRNVFQAAPVQVSRDALSQRRNDNIRGVVVNSGCANAVTGKVGLENATLMAEETDKCFSAAEPLTSDTGKNVPQTLVMSTGVIGQQLPITRINETIPKLHTALGSSHEHWLGAAQAICTTDTFPKLISRTFTLPSSPGTVYNIAGITKGAGMIHPNMATLLGVICTDAKVEPQALRTVLRKCVGPTFNSISIDGDTSTNDTVALFANGAAAPEDAPSVADPLTSSRTSKRPAAFEPTKAQQADYNAFRDVLQSFMTELAKLVVRDGEGATKFVTIRVRTDHGLITAKRVADSIAQSSLVKTALYGKDANWGRILCAVGYTRGVMDSTEFPIEDMILSLPQSSRKSEPIIGSDPHVVQPARTSVSFIPSDGSEELKLLIRGEPQQVDEERAKQILELEDLELLVRLEDDEKPSKSKHVTEAVVYTCDLSHEYVTINGDYRT